MRLANLGHLLVALAGLVILCLGGWTAFQESAANLRGGATPIQKLLAMSDGNSPVGISSMAQTAALLNCNVALSSEKSIEIMYLPDEAVARLTGICAQIAQSITATTPSMSLGWLVLAEVAARSHNAAILSDNIVRSQITAPREYWLAEMRVQLADANIGDLNADALTGYSQDLAVMAENPYEVWTLARRYVSDGAFRQPMQTGLEAAPPEVQSSFLAKVDQLLKSEGR